MVQRELSINNIFPMEPVVTTLPQHTPAILIVMEGNLWLYRYTVHEHGGKELQDYFY